MLYTGFCDPAFIASVVARERLTNKLTDADQSSINGDKLRRVRRELLEDADSFMVFGITLVIDKRLPFTTAAEVNDSETTAGEVKIPKLARFLILGGGQYCRAISDVLAEAKDFDQLSIPFLLISDPGFRSADSLIAQYLEHEPSSSASSRIFHNKKDKIAALTRDCVERVPAFESTTELSKSTISNRSRKLFTLSAIYYANRILICGNDKDDYEATLKRVCWFWEDVASEFDDWGKVKAEKVHPAELRKTKVHCHALALSALARALKSLFDQPRTKRKAALKKLSTIDWNRSNDRLWEGRAMLGGRLSKSKSSEILTANVIKSHLGIQLTDEEAEIEAKVNPPPKIASRTNRQ